ncbi:protein O-linked-mannose beta-1,2-N-acetylglucosaminyltransferase 1 [Penaeus vannamei]|uniref:protein O-linked-mannose beta-1,2-N-acetylglucosaminyltransferase 1 n=1 Tax=Penaeus vannamei TaxID=6689 RepID=UPI00387F65C6
MAVGKRAWGIQIALLFVTLARANASAGRNFPTEWRKISEIRTLRPVNETTLEILEAMQENVHKIQVIVNKRRISIYLNDQEVYEKSGRVGAAARTHSGVHVVALHPLRGHVMLARQFLTHQPAEHRNLAACLDSLMPGNILIAAAVPDAVMFLGPDAVARLEEMGASRIRYLARHETWVMVAHTPVRAPTPPRYRYPVLQPNVTVPAKPLGRVWGESVAVRSLEREGTSAFVDFGAFVPKFPAAQCDWHQEETLKDQRAFCDRYDGYFRLCKCQDPLTPALRHSAEKIEIREVIPLAMLTAVKPFNFYRQLLNVLETPGAAQTPILVLVDGFQREIISLTKLFGLDVLVHRPQGEKGSSTLLNMHFRFSVHNVFNFFPGAKKAIILEDDLLLSPDFLSFFQQTAWLLDEDPTIASVNAFSINSFPEVASDPTVLRRVELVPQFGWLVRREWAEEVYEAWVPERETADWDWWLFKEVPRKQRDTLVPEVSRVIHAGSSGAHVTGYAQENTFNHMVYNEDPYVTLENLEDLTKERYEYLIRQEILRAVTLTLTSSPCDGPMLPEEQPGPFKLFVEIETKNDEYESFYVMQACLRAYPEEAREVFRGVLRYNLQGRLLYVVGCPLSPYCSMFSDGYRFLRPSPWLVDSASQASREWQTRNYPPYFVERRRPVSPEEEFRMENLIYFYRKGKGADRKSA